MTTPLGTTARFTDRQVHLFKEVSEDRAVTYCGLGERADIWRDLGDDVTCGHCIRRLSERVNEIGAKVDGITQGVDGALYG
jgi:hypothetical protein